ncbi:hypothetical protein EP331_07870 [bacterium]|nr:MAG: hypothetical protein EP331_07870 [bacterium]
MAFSQDFHKKIKQFQWIVSFAGLIRIASLAMFIEVTGRFLSPGFNWLHIILVFIPISWLVFHYLIVTDKRQDEQMLERVKKQIPELNSLSDNWKSDSSQVAKLWNEYGSQFKLSLKPIRDSFWFFLACLALASMFYVLPKLV